MTFVQPAPTEHALTLVDELKTAPGVKLASRDPECTQLRQLRVTGRTFQTSVSAVPRPAVTARPNWLARVA